MPMGPPHVQTNSLHAPVGALQLPKAWLHGLIGLHACGRRTGARAADATTRAAEPDTWAPQVAPRLDGVCAARMAANPRYVTLGRHVSASQERLVNATGHEAHSRVECDGKG